MSEKKDEPTINDWIKSVVVLRRSSLVKLCQEFNSRYGTKYSPNSFRRKISNETGLSYVDVQRIGKILGFDVECKLNDKK